MSNEVLIHLPRPHVRQLEVIRESRRFNVVACGRRWGKSTLGVNRLIRPALEGGPVAWFSPSYRMLLEIWRDVQRVLAPATRRLSATEHRLDLVGGGVVEMWSLDNPDSCRGRKYRRVVLDEAAMVRDLEEAWNAVVRPTLTDYRGDAWFLSTPRGRNFFWQGFAYGESPDYPDWACWQMPTVTNPFIDADEVASARQQLPERVYQQEFEALFLEEAGGVFRGVRDCIDAGRKENDHGGSPYDHKYFMGVDLGRVDDFTVIDVFDETGRQCWHERFNQISWPRQIAAIEQVSGLFQHPPCVVDATGNLQPNPIVTELSERGVNAIPFIFTNTSKAQIIDSLAIALEHGRVRLMDVPVQTNELLAYQYEITPSRMVRMAAPSGMHDDCVSALALAHWALAGTGDVVTREAYQEW